MKARALIFLFFMSSSVCLFSQMNQTVQQVDLGKYIGRWYEIASFPARFQKGCHCSTADYDLAPGKPGLQVTNRCIRFRSHHTKLAEVKGRAIPVKGSGNTKLKVQFFWPFRGEYDIIGLADDYSWTLVGHPKKKYLWILCRESYMPSSVYNEILKLLRDKGYDVNKLEKTSQNCDIVK
jgi:apolipoprotein D and lipocalin family protein